MTARVALDHDRPPQIGLIVLQADETIEDDMRRLLPAEASTLVSRVPSSPTLTQESLRAMEGELTQSAALLPRGAEFQAVAYGCTSGTAEIGAARVAELVRAGVETPEVTEPISALLAACAHLGVARLALVSPYVAEISARLRTVLFDAGISTERAMSFDEPLEENVARMSPHSFAEAAVGIGRHSDCDAVFLSCTNLRTLDVIEDIEARIGKPVLSSNQVLAWHLAQLASLTLPASAPGRLFRT